MPTQTSLPNVQLHQHIIDELDTVTITGKGYRAVVLLQGAQLIHFSNNKVDEDGLEDGLKDDAEVRNTSCSINSPDNWLWVSNKAEYKQGESVRGGVPICWPVFGQFNANPQAVIDSFADVANRNAIPQHGYARLQLFELDSFSVDDTDGSGTQTASLILTLDSNKLDDKFISAPNLALKVVFTFNAHGFGIKLITQNNSDKTVTFSQALHSYLPTDDIGQTSISGFEGLSYSDTLVIDNDKGGWQTKTQQGEIRFNSEVDRIYHGAPDITLNTPAQTYYFHAEGSHSTVVWNPWVEKSKHVSQFAADDYQRMLCIETANAHLDVVELGAGESHELTLQLFRMPL